MKQENKEGLIFILIILLIVNLYYYGLPLFACQHKEIKAAPSLYIRQLFNYEVKYYCKKCNLRIFLINGEWKIADNNPFKKWWYK